jgi:DinB family protein
MAHPLTTRPDPSEHAQYAAEYVSRVPPGNVLDVLERQIEETTALVRGLAPGMEDKRYAPEKWTIRQIIGHLGDAERVFSQRAFRFSRCDPTPLPGFDENEYVREAPFQHVPINDLLAELVHLRHATLYLYRSLDEVALMRRGVANGIETSVRALAFIIAGHEHHHLETLRTRYLD